MRLSPELVVESPPKKDAGDCRYSRPRHGTLSQASEYLTLTADAGTRSLLILQAYGFWDSVYLNPQVNVYLTSSEILRLVKYPAEMRRLR